uniref:CSON013841 protein n=1 Tax=Culicoides sonorensis TaxID=179676 RepID=A0A336M8W5_CULSO
MCSTKKTRKSSSSRKNNNNKKKFNQDEDEKKLQRVSRIIDKKKNITGSYKNKNNDSIRKRRVMNRYGIGNSSSNNFTSMLRSWWWIYCCCYMCLFTSHSGINNVVNGAYSTDTDELINELDRPNILYLSGFKDNDYYYYDGDEEDVIVVNCIDKSKLIFNNFFFISVPIISVQGVLAKQAYLPCDITPIERDDAVFMVLWFKGSEGEPLYSFDVRGRQFTQAKLWSSPDAFGPRAFFRTASHPAQLLVDDIQMSDEGIYRCRVDFRNSPTRNLKINFTVIIPPERPIIYDARRRDRTKLIEPYNEGSDVALICEVTGGRPQPNVTWFLDNTIIDESFEVRPDDGVVVNHLNYPNIGRQHLNARLVCVAIKPVAVHILVKEKFVSADKRIDVECKSSGSKPEAIITWYKANKQLKRMSKNFSEQGNQSLSVLTFTPVMDDDGTYLTCRAENPIIPDSAMEDKWRLNIRLWLH